MQFPCQLIDDTQKNIFFFFLGIISKYYADDQHVNRDFSPKSVYTKVTI